MNHRRKSGELRDRLEVLLDRMRIVVPVRVLALHGLVRVSVPVSVSVVLVERRRVDVDVLPGGAGPDVVVESQVQRNGELQEQVRV